RVVQGRVEKMRHPALVFVAELARPGDAGHAEDDGRNAIDAGVIADVLVSRSLRATVRRVEIERLLLGYAAGANKLPAGRHGAQRLRAEAAVHLVGRGKQQEGVGAVLAYRLKDVERPGEVDFNIKPGIGDGGSHRHLGGKV